MTFNFTDAWILVSVYYSEKVGWATVSDTIVCADYSNHAIITFEELSHTIPKLISVGIMKQDQERFGTTEQFSDWWFDAFDERKKEYILTEIAAVETYLNTTFADVVAGAEEEQLQLTEATFRKVVDAYLNK